MEPVSQAIRMAKAFEDGELADVCFKVGGAPLAICSGNIGPDKTGEQNLEVSKVEMVKAHKLVLAIGSPVFKAMFFGPLAERAVVEVPDISPEPFKTMLRFMYFDDIDLGQSQLIEVLYAAKKYDIGTLEKKCCERLKDLLTRENAPTIYAQAVLFCMDDIAEQSLSILDRFAHYSINTNEVVRQFNRNLFETVLKRDTFCAREVDIFDALIWWTKEQLDTKATPSDIRAFLGDLLFLVR